MKRIFPLVLLALAGIASAQDRASVDRFVAGYDKAVVANDDAWFLAHLDKAGKIVEGGHTATYSDVVKESAMRKGKPDPMAATSCKTVIKTLKILGPRATIDYTTAIRLKSTGKTMTIQGHAVAVWRGGDWRMLLIESKMSQ